MAGNQFDLHEQIEKFRGTIKAAILKAAAVDAIKLIKLGFRKSADPYGTPWLPLLRRKGMPLRTTGRLGNSFTTRVTEDGFVAGTNVTYAKYHQDGTRDIPRRAMVPIDRKLPPPWERSIDRVIKTTIERELAKLKK